MYNECTTNVQRMYNECTMNVQWMYNECTTNVQRMYNECTGSWMYTKEQAMHCWMYKLSICKERTECTTNVTRVPTFECNECTRKWIFIFPDQRIIMHGKSQLVCFSCTWQWPRRSQSTIPVIGRGWQRFQHFLMRPQNGTLYSLGTAPGTLHSNHLQQCLRLGGGTIGMYPVSYLSTCHHKRPFNWLSLHFVLSRGMLAQVW